MRGTRWTHVRSEPEMTIRTVPWGTNQDLVWDDHKCGTMKAWQNKMCLQSSQLHKLINSWDSQLSHIPITSYGIPYLSINVLILTSDTLWGWDSRFSCNSVSLIMRTSVWFSATQALWLLERRFSSRAYFKNFTFLICIWNCSIF